MHTYLNANEVERCAVTRAGGNGRQRNVECAHWKLVLCKPVENLMQHTVTRKARTTRLRCSSDQTCASHSSLWLSSGLWSLLHLPVSIHPAESPETNALTMCQSSSACSESSGHRGGQSRLSDSPARWGILCRQNQEAGSRHLRGLGPRFEVGPDELYR